MSLRGPFAVGTWQGRATHRATSQGFVDVVDGEVTSVDRSWNSWTNCFTVWVFISKLPLTVWKSEDPENQGPTMKSYTRFSGTYSPNQYQMRRRSPKFIQVCYPRYNWSSISILHLGIQESPRDWNMCWSENMLPPNLMLTVIRHIGLKLARNLDGPWDQRFLVNDL